MTNAARTVLGRVAPATGEIDLLLAALAPADDAAAAWRRWRVDHDLDGAHGRAHDVFPAVAANLSADELGEDAGRLAGIRRRTWATNQLRFQVVGAALDLLQPLDETPIVVKGVALATTAYPHVGDRSMGDIDLVVGPDLFDEAFDLLAAAGWREGPSSRRASYAHALSVFDAEGNEIDLHRWVMFPRFCRTPETWSERAVSIEVAGRPCRRFAFADELVFAVVHGVGPEFTSSIRWPIDAARLIDRAAGSSVPETDRAAFWNDVVDSADELEVGVPVAEALSFCAEHLGIAVPSNTLQALRTAATGRVVRLEWEMQKRGVPRAERIRPFIDTERAAGRRPSPRAYVSGRLAAAREGGGGAEVIRRRLEKARRVVTSRRQWRRSW